MQLSPIEIIVVAVVALIVLGPDRLPKAARQVGKAIAELKRLSTGVQEQVNEAISEGEHNGEGQREVKADVEDRSVPDQESLPPNPDTEGFRLIDQKQPESRQDRAASPPAPIPSTQPVPPTQGPSTPTPDEPS